jgi:hypothetical protein
MVIATSTDSRSASFGFAQDKFTKPLDEVTGDVSATCNGCCCVPGQPVVKATAGTLPALRIAFHDRGCAGSASLGQQSRQQ